MSIVLRVFALLRVSATGVFAAAVVSSPFDASYTLVDLGPVSGVPISYGGVTFLNNSTMLLGGHANSSNGVIQAVAVNRDGNGHITGFGTVTQLRTLMAAWPLAPMGFSSPPAIRRTR